MLQFIWNFSFRTLFATIIFLVAWNLSFAAKRVALVVGNSNYQNTSSLKNPVNDANLMAHALGSAGFEVTKILDADLNTLKRAMLEFGRRLRHSPEAGLFYYAGHGVQVGGQNYLVPVDANISDEDEIDLEAININSFLRVMNSSSSSINIVVLDACRNNPFARSFRSTSTGGLAPVDAPKGTYIAYATAPGDVASDGEGANSPYSTALAKAIKVPGITIEQVFKEARKSVLDATGAKQVPWETSSITGNFYFHPQVKSVSTTPAQNTKSVVAPQTVSEAESVYKQIKDSNDIDVLEIFAKRFSNSIYADFARAKVKKLKTASLDPAAAQKLVPQPSDAGDPKKSIPELMRSANAAHRDRSYKDALKLYKLAEAKGEPKAMYALGLMNYYGRGLAQNHKEAARYYKKAATNHHTDAMFTLGLLYLEGDGVLQDYKQAARYFKQAASNNNLNAVNSLAILYSNGQGVRQSYKEAVRLYKIAVAKNHSTAALGLAHLYNNGRGVTKNRKTSASLVFKSLVAGDRIAIREMTVRPEKWGKRFCRELQRKMKSQGYYKGRIDGNFGPATIRAIKKVAAG